MRGKLERRMIDLAIARLHFSGSSVRGVVLEQLAAVMGEKGIEREPEVTPLMQIMRHAWLNQYEPTPAPGMIRVHNPSELVVARMLDKGEAETWGAPKDFRDYPHPGWCLIDGCPKAKQVNGSEICRFHADRLGG